MVSDPNSVAANTPQRIRPKSLVALFLVHPEPPGCGSRNAGWRKLREQKKIAESAVTGQEFRDKPGGEFGNISYISTDLI